MSLKMFYRIILIIFFVFTSCKKEEGFISEEDFSYSFTNIEEFPIEESQEFSNWNSTGWGVYKDIIFDGTDIEYSLKHDETIGSSKTLKAEITGGDKYNNVFFTNTIAARWEELDWYFKDATTFEYTVNFFPEVVINCSNSDFSEVEGFEFTVHHVIIPDSWGWGIQWSKNNTWSYWNDQKINGTAIGWVNLDGVNDCIIPNQWNKIKIVGIIENNTVIYDQIEINSENYSLNIRLENVETPNGWFENFIQVGFQINGNEAILTDHNHGVDPVTVYLDNINLMIKN